MHKRSGDIIIMKKFIVTTTINRPIKATKKFSEMKDWQLMVVFGIKTP